MKEYNENNKNHVPTSILFCVPYLSVYYNKKIYFLNEGTVKQWTDETEDLFLPSM
jgi:hypothetical protein